MIPWTKRALHTFKEGVYGFTVFWYEKDYKSVRDGMDGNHSGAHQEVETHFETVRQAIENPDEVRQDRGHKNRTCYYAWFSGDRDYPNHHMKVVIEQAWHGTLDVVTAYFTLDIDPQETTIWTRQ